MNKKNINTLILVLGIVSISYILGIRICPFFRVFKFPCPGCGLSRAFKYLLMGNVIDSIKYNPLAIIITFFLIIYFVIILIGKKVKLDTFINTHIKLVLVFVIILTLIIWIINIHNPLLY